MIKRGANLEVRDNNNFSLLHYAAQFGTIELFDAIMAWKKYAHNIINTTQHKTVQNDTT